VVCFSTFHDVFKSQFNLSFSCPKSDTCNKCDTLNTKVKASPEGDEKKKVTTALELCTTRKQLQQKRGGIKTQLKQNVMIQKGFNS
jgi:hypothetical protein